jgi:hypothetical protein
MKPGENPPVGLILCAEKGAEEVHYALEISLTRCSPPSIRLSFQTKSSSPRNLDAPAKNWTNEHPSAE